MQSRAEVFGSRGVEHGGHSHGLFTPEQFESMGRLFGDAENESELSDSSGRRVGKSQHEEESRRESDSDGSFLSRFEPHYGVDRILPHDFSQL